MPVRLRITLLFSLMVLIILGVVYLIVYYFTYTSRRNYIDARLTNMAITTGRFLSRAETFNPVLIQKIDSLTAIAFSHKTVLAFDSLNRKIYSFNDDKKDTIVITPQKLDEIRVKGKVYTMVGDKDLVYYHYTNEKNSIVIVAAGYDQYGHQNLRQLFLILLFSFIIGLFIAIISGYIFSRRLLKPLNQIAEDVTEISAQNLSRRIQTGSSKDEWYKFADTLNDLLNRLQESFDLQRRFISNASHELSTPLTSISSQLEVSLQRPRDAEEYQKVMQSIYQDVKHMSKLTQTLLEFAKASGNTGGLEINLIRIDEIILGIPAEIVKINPDYLLVLKFDDLPDDEEKLIVFGNDTLLLTAIKNVVINACKYSNDHQAIIRLQVKGKFILITIQDQGSGIPKEELVNIFEPFYRVEENRVPGGFGLGLSLAKRIIKLHKGSITVSSEIGKGTVFTISLPAARELRAF